MTNTINVSVTNGNMSPRFIEVGAEGQEGIIKLSLSFDDGWSGLAKSVVFYDKRRTKTVSYDFLGFDSCEVEIPSAILSEDGRHPFIIVGSEIVGDDADTAREIPRKITECAFICVGDSIYPELNSTAIEALDTDAYSSFLEAYFGCLATAEELKEQYSGLAEKVGKAEGYANSAKSYAVGGTGLRENEDTDNAKHYSERAGASASEAKASEKAANDAKEIAEGKAEETKTALSEMSFLYSQGQSDISAQREAAEKAKVAAEKAKDNAEKAEKSASGYAATCGNNASDSGGYANRALESADKAQSYAVGHTETRDGENTDNAKYYSEVAKNAAVDLETSVANAEAFKVAAQKSAEEANMAYESASEIIGAATEEVNTAKAKTFEARDDAFYAKDKAESAKDKAVEVSEKLSGISDKISKLEAHTTDTNNPHNVTPEQIGAVDNNVIGFMLSTKENKIDGTPSVGQVPVITSVNNGSYTAEWSDIASGGGYKKIGYTDDCDYKVSASSGGKAAFDAAISAASDGDTILVLAGDYGGSGTLTFKKNLTFVGIGKPVISFPITVDNDSEFSFENWEWTLAEEYTTSWFGFVFEKTVSSVVVMPAEQGCANKLIASDCVFNEEVNLCGKLYGCTLCKGVYVRGYSGNRVGYLYLYNCNMLSGNLGGEAFTYVYGGTYRFQNSENKIASSFNLTYLQGAELYTYGCTFSGEYSYSIGIEKCISGCTICSDSNPFDASHCENCVLVTVTPIS